MHSLLVHFWAVPLVQKTGLLLLSVVLGGLIGWNREQREHAAGLRTHILVCLAATLITLVSNSTAQNGGRIAAQIVTGVGFLGAGTIIRDSNTNVIRGLTTAASLWTVASLGIAIGYGGLYAELATITTLIVLFTLTTLNRLEATLSRQRKNQDLTLMIRNDTEILTRIAVFLEQLHALGIKTRDLSVAPIPDGNVVQMQLRLAHAHKRDEVDRLCSQHDDIINHEWND